MPAAICDLMVLPCGAFAIAFWIAASTRSGEVWIHARTIASVDQHSYE